MKNGYKLVKLNYLKEKNLRTELEEGELEISDTKTVLIMWLIEALTDNGEPSESVVKQVVKQRQL